MHADESGGRHELQPAAQGPGDLPDVVPKDQEDRDTAQSIENAEPGLS